MSTQDDVAPDVGERVTGDSAKAILARFDQHFCRPRSPDESANLPSWYFFKTSRTVDLGVFDAAWFAEADYLYVLTEMPRRLFRAAPDAIVRWIHDILNHWAAPDACIFPANCEACAAITMDEEFIASP